MAIGISAQAELGPVDQINNDITCFAMTNDGVLLAGTSKKGIFRSEDDGNNWVCVNTDWFYISEMVAYKDRIIMTAYTGGVFYSEDAGDSWFRLGEAEDLKYVYGLAVDKRNGSLFVGTKSRGIWRSIDHGESWEPVNRGIIGPLPNIQKIIVGNDSDVYFGTMRGAIYRSENNGSGWGLAIDGLPSKKLTTLSFGVSNDGHVFLGTARKGLFISTNQGKKWESLKSLPTKNANTILINEEGHIMVGGRSIYLSKDNGKTWKAANYKLSSRNVTEVFFNQKNQIVAGTKRKGIFLSTNEGNVWHCVQK